MADRTFRPCSRVGCPQITRDRFCPKHEAEHLAAIRESDDRASSHQRGYGWRWGRVSLDYRKRNPLCVHCLAEGRTTPAALVDHKRPWQSGTTELERQLLKWSEWNFQSLCAHHHGLKTAKEDGGWGNPKKIGE